eukprot:9481580-Pyramimonas_sp.AAC.1
MRQIDGLVVQYPTWKNTAETVSTIMSFAKGGVYERVRAFVDRLVEHQAILKETAEIAAMNVVTSAVVKHMADPHAGKNEGKGAKNPVGSALKYTQNFLKVGLDKLPVELRSKCGEACAEDTTTVAAAAPESTSGASVGAGDGKLKKKLAKQSAQAA